MTVVIKLSEEAKKMMLRQLATMPPSFWEEVRLQMGEIEIINDRLIHYGYGETAEAAQDWLSGLGVFW